MRTLCAARMMAAPKPLSADVECGGLLVLSGAEGPPLSVAEARLGDSTDSTTKRNRPLAQRPSWNHDSLITVHQSRFSPQQSDTPCRVIDGPIGVVVSSEHRAPKGLSAALSDTPCKVILRVTHRKQTIGTLTKCHTFSCPPRAICWPAPHAFRIISAPISHKEPRVQGR